MLNYFIARLLVGLQSLCQALLKDLSFDEMIGPDALAVVRPTGDYLLDFFCSSIQFYVLLSPFLCFISILYLEIYVLGDDALISQESFMQTKHLCALIHIWTKGEDDTMKQV